MRFVCVIGVFGVLFSGIIGTIWVRGGSDWCRCEEFALFLYFVLFRRKPFFKLSKIEEIQLYQNRYLNYRNYQISIYRRSLYSSR